MNKSVNGSVMKQFFTTLSALSETRPQALITWSESSVFPIIPLPAHHVDLPDDSKVSDSGNAAQTPSSFNSQWE